MDRMHAIVKRPNLESAQSVTDGMGSLLDVYTAARDMEARNRDHYLQLAEVCSSAEEALRLRSSVPASGVDEPMTWAGVSGPCWGRRNGASQPRAVLSGPGAAIWFL